MRGTGIGASLSFCRTGQGVPQTSRRMQERDYESGTRPDKGTRRKDTGTGGKVVSDGIGVLSTTAVLAVTYLGNEDITPVM